MCGWFQRTCALTAGFVAVLGLLPPSTMRRPQLPDWHAQPCVCSAAQPAGRLDGFTVEVVSEGGAAHRRPAPRDRIAWGPDAALRSGKVQLWPVFAIRPDRKRVFHITDPWMTTEQCLVSVGPLKTAGGAKPWCDHRLHVWCAPGPQRRRRGGHPLARCGRSGGRRWCVESFGALLLNRPAACETVDFNVTPLPKSRLDLRIGSIFGAVVAADTLRAEVVRIGAMELSHHTAFRKICHVRRRTKRDRRSADRCRTLVAALMWGTAGSVAAPGRPVLADVAAAPGPPTAEKANAVKSEFLANISQEVRMPYTTSSAWRS
jgi:hypothetical protein